MDIGRNLVDYADTKFYYKLPTCMNIVNKSAIAFIRYPYNATV